MNATRVVCIVFVAALLALPLTAVVGQERPLPSKKGGAIETDDMNDRFAVEKFTPAAHGKVRTLTVQDGEIAISRVQIQNLPSGREFEVVVTVGADGDKGFNPVVIVESDPIEIGGNGLLRVTNFEVGTFAPGTYRVDILIFPAGDGFPRDFILACDPAPFVEVR